ncbi:unnamed protein product [Bursaphelenchus xylophilus]|uniref:(pine wood nematode) hypothetical protein n=1 Tax=Bursaphelenchus xylophilus TaxID=6326 RepID=A0A811KES6_BURXY|nr:unnamed protein product [Bursaphelenchus xylophilus]CAG9093549.1 unnamed protein product [Bursaphelenchus xylophilus]
MVLKTAFPYGESAGKRDQSRHQQGAKERVRRIKEHTAQPSGIHEGAASHRFEKQVRKSSVSAQQPQSAAPRANAPCGLTGDERSARPDPNQRNRPSLPERFIDDEAECVADSSGPQEVNVDVKFEVAPQSQAEYRRLSDFHEQPDQPPAPGTTQDHPTPQKGASHRTFLTSESTGQEAVIQLVFESRLPSTALAATRQPLTTPTVGASHLEQELSLKLDKTLQQTVESLVKTLSNLCPTPSPPAPSTPIPPPPEPRKKSHKRRDRKRRKHRDVAEPEEESQAPSEASLYVRRHTLPDMTVATYGMVICGTDDLHHRYRGRIEKVKFGVPISEAFSHDIPATLLVLLLKVNKEGPLKKDIWRAPGNQAQVRKLSHIMQHGRLVNISHISVYTAASVIKKFLSKLPGGIFGAENEQLLFSIMQQPDAEQQRLIFCRAISSLSIPSQHLLVLLFGTFRIIADNAETFNTRMSADAIGISVAPSLFHTCIHDGQRAKLEDVMRFKLASQVISTIIKSFGCTNLFPRECYEFYARITGRTLHVDDDWNFTFQYPSNSSKPDTTTFSTMLSSISAAMAARSYSLDTLGEESMTAELARASIRPGIQRGGSLKTAEFSIGRRVEPDGYSHQKSRSSNPVMVPTGKLLPQRSVTELTNRLEMAGRANRPPLSACTNNPARFAGKAASASALPDRKPSVHRQQSAGLVYAQRVVVSDSPPHGPPPAPPSRQSPQKCRLIDSEMNGSNSCDF